MALAALLPLPAAVQGAGTLAVVGARLGILGAAGLAARHFAAGGQPPRSVDMTGKVVIVTGANTGCGYHTALQLAQMGAHVIMACRNPVLGREAVQKVSNQLQRPGCVEYAKLDLADLQSVKSFVDEFKNRPGAKLDVLVNNAGIMFVPFSKSAQGHEMHFAVNHLGHFLLTTQLMPLLSKSKGRVVNVSSMALNWAEGGRIQLDTLTADKYNPQAAYGLSKLANALFTRELAKRADSAGTGVQVVALHPGVVATELGRHAPPIVQKLSTIPRHVILKTAAEGAWTSVTAATAPTVRQGGFYIDSKVRDLPPFAQDDAEAAKLWSVSEQLTRAFS